MVRTSPCVHDHDMIAASPSPRRNVEQGTPRERSASRHDVLSRATGSLMRTAAAVRRSAGHPQEMAELSRSLGHVEEALDDLSAGMARLAMAVGEDNQPPGGVAWRLHTLHHALRAARDLCAGAKSATPDTDAHSDSRSLRSAADMSSA
jgi:hypothetical protein